MSVPRVTPLRDRDATALLRFVQDNHDLTDWYFEIPVVTRAYFTLSLLLTAACALEVLSPLSLYLNPQLVYKKGEVSI
jgi:hypothetical protein